MRIKKKFLGIVFLAVIVSVISCGKASESTTDTSAISSNSNVNTMLLSNSF